MKQIAPTFRALKTSPKARTFVAIAFIGVLSAFTVITAQEAFAESRAFVASASPITPVTPPQNDNVAPEVKTKKLKNTRTNRNYHQKIKVVDQNPNQTIQVTAAGLPEGLAVTTCTPKNNKKKTRVVCQITGKATQAGTYPVTITATDNFGAFHSNEYTITVR